VWRLTVHEVAARYRGSLLGVFWSLLSPLLLLALYTFVFGVVFPVRWGAAAQPSRPLEASLRIFAGLIVFNALAESLLRAPGLLRRHVSYVKKVVFPVEVLPVVPVLTAVVHASVGIAVLAAAVVVHDGRLPWTAALWPLPLVPVVLVGLGATYLMATLGAFVRDLEHLLGLAVTGLLFLSPIFYPRHAAPPLLAAFLDLNPLTAPIEGLRSLVIEGNLPTWPALALQAAFGAAVALAGIQVFCRFRRGFADAL
jgi:lipopolysaccharide transport system permease protein